MIAETPHPALMGAADDDLDSTVIRKLDELITSSKRPTLPPWLLPLVIYLVGQLVGSVWWAATMQSDVRYLQNENLKLWQKVETHDIMLGKMDETIRRAVKDAMQDADYVRIQRKGE